MKSKTRSILAKLHRNEDGFAVLDDVAYALVWFVVIAGGVKIAYHVIPPAYNAVSNFVGERLHGKMGTYTPENYNQNNQDNNNPGPTGHTQQGVGLVDGEPVEVDTHSTTNTAPTTETTIVVPPHANHVDVEIVDGPK